MDRPNNEPLIIGGRTFEGCNLTELILPIFVLEIGKYAFSDNKLLKRAVLPPNFANTDEEKQRIFGKVDITILRAEKQRIFGKVNTILRADEYDAPMKKYDAPMKKWYPGKYLVDSHNKSRCPIS
jgi:hypothetical protein